MGYLTPTTLDNSQKLHGGSETWVNYPPRTLDDPETLWGFWPTWLNSPHAILEHACSRNSGSGSGVPVIPGSAPEPLLFTYSLPFMLRLRITTLPPVFRA